jgi:hypothetical protein
VAVRNALAVIRDPKPREPWLHPAIRRAESGV